MANPDHNPKSPRERSQVLPLDGDRLAVLENRLAELESRMDSPAVATVEHMARVLKALHLMIDEAAARLEWYAKAGTRMRELFSDLIPEDDGIQLPTLADAMSAVADDKTVTSRSDSGGGMPPQLAQLLAGLGVKL